MYNPYSLEGKTILVTGASSGIGKATAIECSKLGATLVITARNEQRLKETLDALEGEGHQMFITDVSETKQIEELVNKLPVVNGVACNAGIVNTTLVNFYQDEIIEKLFKTNTFSMMMLTKFLVKKKKLAKGGSIVYTSSIGNVFNADIANGIYGATKCAIDGFMRTAALELAAKGIRCNTVNPGMINTPAINGLGAITSEQLEKDAQRYPLKRFGKPEEIAYGIIYLLSDASSFVTGTALKIDGGITL
jgi:NAD(P)-dependent dehydrogenase (short-subunit alcohol dehydrogenase family)